MKKLILLMVAVALAGISFGQKNGVVKGVAYDSLIKESVASATISVLSKKDSSLVTFTMTGRDGKFELRGLEQGEYRLLVSHVSYHNAQLSFTISDSSRTFDAGNLLMQDKTTVLEGVMVSNEAPPITLINDTIQYNAGSFRVQPNATVEQLLSRLPGVQVEKDGTIRAQGENVRRVLVDGKEFFGSDPKIATKNLPADAIDKVQVYDRQSDQAQLTGFDDGNYEKTINLKLKKDKKKGLFGTASAGGGNQDRYEGKFNTNSFKGARQLSAIGMGNNTNAEGFSMMDILNFSGELARMQRGGGGNINISISPEDAAAMGINMGGRNNGINTSAGGGVNYNNIIGTKLDFQSSYFYNKFNPYLESHLQRKAPDGSYYYNEDAVTNNLSSSHRLNLNMLYQLDSFNSIRITPSLSLQRTNNRSQRDYETLLTDRVLANDGNSESGNRNEGYNFRNDIIWRKKFARKGRTFSLSLQTSLNESEGDGSLSSVNSFYNADGSLRRRDTLNQQNRSSGSLKSYNARAVYTEPIWKRSLLEFSAAKSNSLSAAQRSTFDYNKTSQKYDRLNPQLSNDFENSYGYTTGGLRVRSQRKKYNYSLGLTWQEAELEGIIMTGAKDSVIRKSFRNLLPNASLRYNFSRFKSLTLNYAASTNQPGITQLQPVPDISNPLNIRMGNPDLKQEYSHALRGNMNLVSPSSGKNLFLFFRAQATSNWIVNYDSVNLNTGVRTTRPVNVNGVYSLNSEISYSHPVRFVKGSFEIRSRVGYDKGKQFINTVENEIRTFTSGPSLRLLMNPGKRLNIILNGGINYNKTNYSVQTLLNTDFMSQVYGLSVDWSLPKGFFLSSEFDYTINSRMAAGYNEQIPLWNASVSKQMLKMNRGELKLRAFDLLNKNIGISRNATSNYIDDNRVLTLRQYFMLSFTYSLNKAGLNTRSNNGAVFRTMAP